MPIQNFMKIDPSGAQLP